MGKKTLISIVLLGGIALAGLFFLPAPQPAPTLGNAVNGVATIIYSDNGFDPESVTIKQGEAVRFVNHSRRPFWPASDPHPIHDYYPVKSANDCSGSSFDACKPVPVGDEWQFTFTTVGEWPFHDHLDAGNIGTIIVKP